MLIPSQDAACWLRKARLSEESLEGCTNLLNHMTRALQLLSARMSLSDSADSQLPAKKAPLVAPWASGEEPEDEFISAKAPAAVLGASARCVPDPAYKISLVMSKMSLVAPWHPEKGRSIKIAELQSRLLLHLAHMPSVHLLSHSGVLLSLVKHAVWGLRMSGSSIPGVCRGNH